MSPEDIDRIAAILAEKTHERKQDFYIDPERHYQDHHDRRHKSLNEKDEADLRQLIEMFQTVRGLFFRSFLGLAIIGTIALAGYGLIKNVFK